MKCLLTVLILLANMAVQAQTKNLSGRLGTSTSCMGDVDANLEAFQKRVEKCRGCDMIVFPELFVSGCEMKKKDKEVAVQTKDEIAGYYPTVIEKMKEWAAGSGALIIGSTIYKEEGFYNRLLAVFPDGHYEYYDKHNCFKKGSSRRKQLVLNWKGHRLATYICYDLRFPDWSRNEDRYDTAIYIANWPESRRDDWNRLLRERAIENQANIIAVNCAGLIWEVSSMRAILTSCLPKEDCRGM